MLEQLLPPHDVKVALDLGVFLGKAVDFFLGKAAAKTGVEFAGKLAVH
jgi:hypothetical protein